MSVEVTICQCDRLPEILMISETPTIEGTSKHIKWENECGGNSSTFWGEFWKTLHTQNRIFQTFQNYWNLDLLHFCMYQYDKYNSKKVYGSVYVCGSYHLSLSDVPEMFISQTHRIGGHQNTSHRKGHMEEILPPFGVTFAKPFLLKIQYSKPSKIIEIWTLHISVFVNMPNIIVKSYIVLYMCMGVMICQSERSPEILVISQTPTIGGHQNTSDQSRNMEETLPAFGVSFAKPFLPKIGYS